MHGFPLPYRDGRKTCLFYSTILTDRQICSAAARSKPSILDPSGHFASAHLPSDSHFDKLFAAFYCPLSINAAGAKNNPDTFTFDQAMARDNKDKWIESAKK